jgi:DNA repair protein RadC
VQIAGSITALARMSLQEKSSVPGLGKAGALAIEAAFELGCRVMTEMPADKIRVRTPSDVAQMLMAQLANEPQEHFVVLVLSTRNDLLATVDLYKGSLNCSHVRASEVFHEAIVRHAAAVIIVHNHPSGDPTPSPEDVEVTRQLVAASNLLDIEVLDHLIIGQQRWISLRERGLGFSL